MDNMNTRAMLALITAPTVEGWVREFLADVPEVARVEADVSWQPVRNRPHVAGTIRIGVSLNWESPPEKLVCGTVEVQRMSLMTAKTNRDAVDYIYEQVERCVTRMAHQIRGAMTGIAPCPSA